MSTHWANIPAIAVVVLGVAGIGSLQGGVTYLFHGDKPRPILRDNFDFMMEKRDERLEREAMDSKAKLEAMRRLAAETEQAK
ncbi:Hypothetical Protein FCC1311_001582 [Hondaea fermentalgiana]|uniref:NADH dehydrogenase [ubiquinone] 1 alpha subcomplex subunit 1 n=1 Tax=Hondaea fermentalgiana TaxID=2315210 RepID=A0A2R5G0W9_9STRA|nr:Hypothetical Protein FCC1311_001582 [Hondaea fermentalgiana]|eukprot:GBG23939.1 Hypothetical Protein FCC1311_001582 [Hondaea fermentalgiana]